MLKPQKGHISAFSLGSLVKVAHMGQDQVNKSLKSSILLAVDPTPLREPTPGEWNHMTLWCQLSSECLLPGQPSQPPGSRCVPAIPYASQIWRTSHSSAFLDLECLPLPWALTQTLCPHVPPACQVNSGATRATQTSYFEALNWILYQIMLQDHDLVRKSNYTWGENNFSKYFIYGK